MESIWKYIKYIVTSIPNRIKQNYHQSRKIARLIRAERARSFNYRQN